MLALIALAARCLHLQYFKHEYYRTACENQQRKLIPMTSRRGSILDCRGRVLAASDKIRIVFAEPRIIKDPKKISPKLQQIINMPGHKICRRITDSNNPGFALLKTGVSQKQADRAAKVYGVGVQSKWRRKYPIKNTTAHVVGFTSTDNRGLAGVELYYQNKLNGTRGQNVYFADIARRPIRFTKKRQNLQQGLGLILTIDATIQEFAKTELAKQLQQYQAESAVAIVAQPQTAAILALVSLPDFDPQNITNADTKNLRNRALTDPFEPGSIIKPIVAAIALDSGAVNYQEKIFCENGQYHGRGFGTIGEYGSHRYANLTVSQILVKSSNIGMAKIGQRLGKKRLYEGLRMFGFGKKTQIDLPGEAKGLLRKPRKWTGYSVTRIPFGQEISVTAIQIMKAYCILANGGRSVTPFVVRTLVDNNGKLINVQRPLEADVGFIISPEVAKKIVRDALAGVVNEGTGQKAKLVKRRLFGKTGTANIALKNAQGYSSDNYVASFIAGTPPENPKILVLVSIRKPNKALGKGYTGGTVAAPVAARIIEKTLNYLEKNRLN